MDNTVTLTLDAHEGNHYVLSWVAYLPSDQSTYYFEVTDWTLDQVVDVLVNSWGAQVV